VGTLPRPTSLTKTSPSKEALCPGNLRYRVPSSIGCSDMRPAPSWPYLSISFARTAAVLWLLLSGSIQPASKQTLYGIQQVLAIVTACLPPPTVRVPVSYSNEGGIGGLDPPIANIFRPRARGRSRGRTLEGGGEPVKTSWVTVNHSIFGEVVEGQDIADKITDVPRNRARQAVDGCRSSVCDHRVSLKSTPPARRENRYLGLSAAIIPAG